MEKSALPLPVPGYYFGFLKPKPPNIPHYVQSTSLAPIPQNNVHFLANHMVSMIPASHDNFLLAALEIIDHGEADW